MEAPVDTAIVWFRRDLRLDDNPALIAALQTARNVVPLFIWAPEEEGQFQPGRTSRWWSQQSVLDLQRQLAALGSRLILRRSSERCLGLLQAVEDFKAHAVFFNNLYDPFSLVSDHEIKQALAVKKVVCKSFNADMLFEPWEVLDEKAEPYTTFADFWDRVISKPCPPPQPLPAPTSLPPVCTRLVSECPTAIDWFMTAEQEAASSQLRFKWKPGVAGAMEKLQVFVSGKLPEFDQRRALVDQDSSSELSAWIHMGSISTRGIFYTVKHFEAACAAAGMDKSTPCAAFLRQLGFREYARYLAFFFPFIHERSLLAHLRHCPWRLDQAAFKAWRQGQTGYPLVDAAMKQLWSTGWIHNRLRVVAASFAVKHLLLPWQWGLKHFWDAQLDADLENDALGWQYISGGMADSHPFSFIIDIAAESQRLDPSGQYVRRWLPALALLPTEHIHTPWAAPPSILAAADVELGANYPRPIISMAESVVNLQHAVEALDVHAAAAAAQHYASGSARQPYRLPTDPLPQYVPQHAEHEPSPSVLADDSRGGVAGQGCGGSSSTHGSTEATDSNFKLKVNTSSMPGSGSGTQRPESRTGPGPSSGQQGATRERTPAGRQQVGVLPGVGFDYVRYRQQHSQQRRHYIDVRSVPVDMIKDASAGLASPTARRGAADAVPGPFLGAVPGTQEQALWRAAMAYRAAHADSKCGVHPQGGGAGGTSMSHEDECMSEEVGSNTIGLSMPQGSQLSGYVKPSRSGSGIGCAGRGPHEPARPASVEECGESQPRREPHSFGQAASVSPATSMEGRQQEPPAAAAAAAAAAGPREGRWQEAAAVPAAACPPESRQQEPAMAGAVASQEGAELSPFELVHGQQKPLDHSWIDWERIEVTGDAQPPVLEAPTNPDYEPAANEQPGTVQQGSGQVHALPGNVLGACSDQPQTPQVHASLGNVLGACSDQPQTPQVHASPGNVLGACSDQPQTPQVHAPKVQALSAEVCGTASDQPQAPQVHALPGNVPGACSEQPQTPQVHVLSVEVHGAASQQAGTHQMQASNVHVLPREAHGGPSVAMQTAEPRDAEAKSAAGPVEGGRATGHKRAFGDS